MEVFPALALPSMDPNFFGRLSAPKYNPKRKKTFRLADWVRVAEVAAQEASLFGCEGPIGAAQQVRLSGRKSRIRTN